jgi:FtsZ-binding cell division protein ZapB
VTHKPWWLDVKVTIGNIVTTALVLISIGVMYSRIIGTIDTLSDKVVVLDKQNDEFKRDVSALRGEIQLLKDSQSTRQIEIASKLGRIEAILEHMQRVQVK